MHLPQRLRAELFQLHMQLRADLSLQTVSIYKT